ncbi:MAG: PQQ-dependent sugar dehydrogenase [Opitutaceae bacterium]|nr:PQQ-dependent sugar dehydrogenase [Opitutaceae bacterium]
MFSRIRIVLAVAFIVALNLSSFAAPTFTNTGFVDEEIHKGNGTISLRFDQGGRLYVAEKQGRILQFKPNTGISPLSFAWQYYERPVGATWNVIPNLDSLTPDGTGNSATIAIPSTVRADHYALRFTGDLPITDAGAYTFYTQSDDGSKVYVNGTLVVDHDGLHGNTEKSGTITLAAGTHTVRVDYLEANGGEALQVSYSGPNLPKQIVGANRGPFKAPAVFATLTGVNTAGERGFLGLALDPDYLNNRYLYVLYSTDTDQRISRLTANSTFTAVEPGSETILLSGLPNTNNVHKAGDIAFHPDDDYRLYVMLGDDGNRTQVGNLDLYAGKLLRIDSSTGLGLPDNPHWDGNPSSVRSRIWSHRYRNPFRFAFDPAAPVPDVLYISENGDGTDRIARITKGADGGWDNQFTTDSADGKRKILYTTQPSLTAITLIRGGVFAPDGVALYNARYGGDDRKEIRRWYLTGPNLDTLTPFPGDNGQPFLTGFTSFNIVSFELGPDGHLYFTDSNQGSSTGTNYRIGRIRYQGGTAPVAAFTASPVNATGPTPLAITFNDTSTAPGSTLSSWAWDFGDGSISTQPSPVHTFTSPGIYTVTLTVTNAQGLRSSHSATITAFHPTELTLNARLYDARTAVAIPLSTATSLRLYQHDGITPLAFTGGTGPAGNSLDVPPGGVLDTTVAVNLTGPGIVVSAGEPAADSVEAAHTGFALSTTAANQTIAPVFRLSDVMIRGRIRDTLGTPLALDIGVARGSSPSPYAVSGGRDFLPVSGHPPSGTAHRLVSDALGYYHAPVRSSDGDASFTLDTAADTLATTHGRVVSTFAVPAAGTIVRDLIVGLQNGGQGRDNLSAIAVTPNVTFTQIQAVFTANCAACHNDIATNSGGLDLQAGASYAALVNQTSVEARGVKLVDPGHPERSYLMEKINSMLPQVGTRMRPGDPMPVAQQALLRDWITQLASAGTLSLSATTYAAQETGASTTVVITVKRTGGSTGAVSVNLATTSGGSALAGVDYTALSTTLSWTDGDTTDRTVTLTLLPDTLVDGGKTIGLQLSSPTGGALLEPAPGATVTLADSPLQLWQAAHFGADANTPAAQPLADPDNDSLYNLLEYGIGTSPVSALSGPSSLPSLSNSAGALTLTFKRERSDLTYTVLGSNDLAIWTTVATNPGTVGQTVTATDTETNSPKRFLRLRVSQE